MRFTFTGTELAKMIALEQHSFRFQQFLDKEMMVIISAFSPHYNIIICPTISRNVDIFNVIFTMQCVEA